MLVPKPTTEDPNASLRPSTKIGKLVSVLETSNPINPSQIPKNVKKIPDVAAPYENFVISTSLKKFLTNGKRGIRKRAGASVSQVKYTLI
tara:strand:- start:1146 stop:1415 length:270 start_codon:yes stop_codon:yes gene_type:complete